MIDKPLITPVNGHAAGSGLASAVLELTRPATPRDDGSVEVSLPDDGTPSESSLADVPFGANLAEHLPDNLLGSIASDIRYAVDEDKSSRGDWEDALAKGMDLLGIKDQDRQMPWPGACGVVHPMVLEAAVRFQSKSITRLFPPEGPASAKVVGESNEDKIQQAKRVAADLNYWLVDRMMEYRDETEQLLFALPVDGSAFKKVFFDPLLKRPVAQFVPANDFIMPFGFPNLETCPRYTHVVRKAFSDVRRLQAIGFYRNILLSRDQVEVSSLEEKVIRLSGVGPSYARNELLTLWETTTELILENGEPLPYVITLEANSNRILSIYRNWRQGDLERAKVLSFVHYRYVPWKGPYGLGLIHLIGGIGHSSTSILRQLVDAGTLSNLPGGLKSRQLRIKGDNDPIQPGEFRDVDVPAGKIADSIAFLPYKEPSATLFSLLKMLVDEGKSFASIAELDLTTSTQNAPVGTTLALIERATEVITAVQSRMHTALGRELSIIAELIRDHTGGNYDYDPPNNMPRSTKAIDYAQQISIVPVSDPAASTMAQRVMEYQAAMQLSNQAPQLYNLPLLHRSMLEVLGIDNADQIVPDKTAAQVMDPVAENMALLTSKPVKAFQWQDHASHITVHMGFINSDDPKMKAAMQQNPLAPSIQSASYAHVNEHLGFLYRAQIEQQMGVPLPALGAQLPPEIEEQLASVVAAAQQKLTGINQQAAQAQQNQQAQQDPVMQQQQAELELKQQEASQKATTDQAKLQLDVQRVQQKGQIETAKIQAADRRTQMQVQAESTRHLLSEQADHAQGLAEINTARHGMLLDHAAGAEQRILNERKLALTEAAAAAPPAEVPPES